MARVNLLDPTGDLCPDYASDAFEQDRANVIGGRGLSHEIAAGILADIWQTKHEAALNAWQAQIEEDEQREEERRAAEEEAARQKEAADELARQDDARVAAALLRQQEAHPEAESGPFKASKMNTFDEAKTVDSFIAPRPSEYAVSRLQDGKYVDLYYFTREGCLDAAASDSSTSDDTFGLSRTGSGLTLKPVSASRASKNVIPDQDLTWEQMLFARNVFVQQIQHAQWPASHVQAILKFFVGIEVHPFTHMDEMGLRALIVYQARVRRDWHARLTRNEGFNLSIFNEVLLNGILVELTTRHLRNAQTVSLLPS